MYREDLFIAGLGSCLPGVQTAEEAEALGLYGPEERELTRQLSVTVAAPGQSVPEMAVAAARLAAARAGVGSHQVDAVFHAAVLHAGIDIWNIGSYVQRAVAQQDCFVAEIRSGSNGGLVALELAANHLAATGGTAAVITAGDVFPAPVFDKWGSDRIHYGDGCAAIVISTREGFARVLSMVTTSDPELEGMHRGAQPFGPFLHDATTPIDLTWRNRHFTDYGMERAEIWKRLDRGHTTAVERSLAEAGLKLSQIDHIVVPHFGAHLTTQQLLRPLGLSDLGPTTWEFSRRVGHLGPADQLAGLNHLAETGALAPGDRLLLLGAGAGFTWSSTVVEVTSALGWALPEGEQERKDHE